MLRSWILSLPLALAAALAVAPAYAVPITASFSGVITRHGHAATISGFGDKFPIGTPFTFSYTLDPDAAGPGLGGFTCIEVQDGRACQYTESAPGAFAASLTIGGRVLSDAGNVVVQIGNDLPHTSGDSWTLSFDPIDEDIFRARVIFDNQGSQTDIRGQIDSADFFVNTSAQGWPRAVVDVSGFPSVPRPSVGGDIIPEPTSAALLLIGLGAMGVVVMIRRSASQDSQGRCRQAPTPSS